MLLIPCPWCGERHETEFTYGGDGSVTAPRVENTVANDWHTFVYDRKNPAGALTELWHHSYGCGKWIKLKRDTTTNEFLSSEKEGA